MAEYQLVRALPTPLDTSLPSIEHIEHIEHIEQIEAELSQDLEPEG